MRKRARFGHIEMARLTVSVNCRHGVLWSGMHTRYGFTVSVKQQQLPEQVVLQRYVSAGLGILGIL